MGVARALRSPVVVVVSALVVVGGAVRAEAAVRPDLVVSALTTPATVSAQGVLAVSVAVRNGGRGVAKTSLARVFLSRDRRVGGDRALGVVRVSALGAGVSSAVLEGELALPRSVRPGRSYVVVCADAGRRVVESRETNNCRVAGRALRVVKARPELAVSAIGAVPATARSDRPGSVSVTVRNRGGATAKASVVALVLSTDARRDARDVAVGSRPVPRLAARARSGGAVALVVPASLPSGSYIVIACVGAVCRAGPRLSVTDVALAPSPVGSDRPTDFAASVRFLYEGEAALQQGVVAGAIADGRVAVVRGRVVDRSSSPVAGVRVSVVGRPELGFTVTRRDGMFDLAVNGGGPLDLDYRVAGFLPVQRSAVVPWHDFAAVPDVVLTALDPAVTTVASGSTAWQVHRGSVVTDADGSRRATLLFAPGTKASLRLADGSLRPASSIAVRATEFTQGASGLDAMPGALPPASAYTYAVDYSADEAIAAGAVGVTFDRPVVTYTEDFVGFPVGASVPAGVYDAGRGRWEADPNGLVVAVVSVTGGVAALDVDGDGVADSGGSLTALGVTDGELGRVGALYAAGARLMRVATTHFSAQDYNWPAGPPDGGTAPSGAPQNDGPGSTCRAGSVIICESQTLAERIPVAGTSYALVYASDRVPGRVASRSLRIPLRPVSMPLVPNAIHLVIQVAGQTISQDFSPTTLETTFTWDGRDGYGRPLDGWVAATVQVGYEYFGQYYASSAEKKKAFGAFSGVVFTQGVTPPPPTARAAMTVKIRRPIVVWRTWHTHVGSWDLRGLGIGGWVLDPLAVYDRDAGVVLNGDGTGERADRAAYRSVSLVAGWNGIGTASGYAGDGTKGVGARLSRPDGVAVAPDGTIYIADPGNGRVRRVGTEGIITSVYGGARCPVSSCRPVDVAIGSDGSLYVADTYRYQVLRIAADGAESVVAGNGTVGYSGDNGPATLAQLAAPTSLAVGPDDAVWIKDTGPSNDARIRRVAPDGTITTAMGAGPAPPAGNPFGDGLPADQIRLGNVGDNGLAVGPDGTVYVVDYQTTSFVRAITPDGIQHRFAGAGPSGPGVGDGKSALDATISQARSLAVGPDGSVYIGEAARLRRVAPDGTISTVAGDGVGQAYSGDDGPAGSARVWAVAGIAVAPDGGIVFADRDNHRVRVIRSVLANTATGEQALASRDGTVVYRFDAAGRHTETVDGLTGATLTRLAYDSAGRLATITDRHGLATTVEHDAAGSPTAIVAPGGQRTTLSTDASGYLTTITDPVGATIHLTSTGSGLLTTLGDRRGNTHTFTYDPLGLLSTDTDPAGGTQTLTRTILTHGAEVAVTTTLGRQTLYRYELQADGSVLERTTTPSGAVTETLERPDGTIHTAYPDGAVEDLTTGPDPRFGERVPITTRDVLAEPAGPTSTTTMTRTATTEPGGGIATLTDTTTRNGAAWTTAYTGATRTIVTTSPAGRTTTTTLNAQDDITAEQQGTLAPVTATYDARGRLATITQGALNYTAAHDAADNLIAVTDALGAAVHYTYDASGRRVTETTPSGRVYTVTRDASGNIDTLAMPGATSDKHVLSWDTLDRIASYTAPGRHSLTAAYDADRELATITEPGGATIVPAHDAAGRETSRTSTDTVATTTYVDATDRVAAATNAPSSGPSQTSAYEYTGDLPTRDSETGAATGDIRRTFSNDLDVAAWSLDGVASTVTHDADRLVTGDGPWAWTFDENGLQTATTGDPGDVIAISRDGLGRVTRRTVTVNGVEKHRVDISYDNAGRVATRTDTVAGTPASRTYTHDVDGRLTAVAGTGETSAYTYDLRDNLTGGPGGAIAYTGSDLVVGDTYDEDGRLGVRGGNTYTYTTRGDLTTAVTAAGPTTYAYDASGRRVTRTHAGVTTTYLYANPSDPFQLSASKQGATTTVYRYDDAGALAAFEVGAARYLVATDQVGSPLAAYDAATGAPYLTRTYDAYGRQLAATGPADFPIGYAGGLADPNTGLVRFGYRDYDPATGRFTAPDPTLYGGGQYNLYTYVNADPATETDRSGTGAREFAHNYVNLLFDFVDHPIDTTFWVLDRDLQATRSALKSLHKACSSPPPDAGPLLVPPPPPTYPTQRKGGSRRTPTGEPEFRSILH